jgi:hypothetical protein
MQLKRMPSPNDGMVVDDKKVPLQIPPISSLKMLDRRSLMNRRQVGADGVAVKVKRNCAIQIGAVDVNSRILQAF